MKKQKHVGADASVYSQSQKEYPKFGRRDFRRKCRMTMSEAKGITLIALIITIIVLLILAMVSIKLIIDKGIISFANISKEETIIAGEKEKITLAYSDYKISKINNPNYTMQEALNSQKAEATSEGDETLGWNITFQKTNHQYLLNPDGAIDEGVPDRWDGIAKQEPEITEDKNWHIYNTAQMKYFADFVNENLTEEEKGNLSITADTIVYLEADLDLGARANPEGEKIVGTEWTPVGIDNKKAFIGTFEGNNHYITGIYVNIAGNFGGIFGNSNTIKNLIIKNSYIKATNCSGGIVGALRTGTIENCHNKNTIVKIEARTVGGVVGQLTSNANIKIINCSNTGIVMGNEEVGGVIGRSGNSITIENCSNIGVINGNTYVGGVIGKSNTSVNISKCINKGEVEGKGERIGGVIGDAGTSSNIENCSNGGNIYGESDCVGGCAGMLFGNIDRCYNTGTVEGKGERIGGICGNAAYNTTISESYNSGNIIGEGSNIGGCIGILFGDVDNCYNTRKSIIYKNCNRRNRWSNRTNRSRKYRDINIKCYKLL